MPASAEKVFEVGLPFEHAVSLVKQILPEISAVIDQADDQKGTFVAKKDRSAKSFGELIRVEIETVPDQGCRIRVNSTSTSETTVNDLGVNDENIAAFERSLALHLSPPAPAPTQPNVTDLSSLLTPQTAQSIPASSYVPQAMPTSNYYPPRPTKDLECCSSPGDRARSVRFSRNWLDLRWQYQQRHSVARWDAGMGCRRGCDYRSDGRFRLSVHASNKYWVDCFVCLDTQRLYQGASGAI